MGIKGLNMAYDDTTAYLQGVASNALTQATNNAARIWGLQNVAANTRDPSFDITLVKPDIGPPPKFSDLFEGDTTDPTIQYLNEQADAWIAKYCPEINDCFKTLPEDVLCGILNNTKPYGLDKSILELVWHQARDRASRTKRTEQANVAAAFSARGFSMPPGAMADTMAGIEQRAADVALDVSREQAIKDADIKVDIFKTAMSLSVQYKTAILSALADFYRLWITIPDKDIERARVKAQAQASLYSALSSYYNVEISFQALRLQAEQSESEVDLGVDRNTLTKQSNYMGIAGPLSSAVSAFAQTAGNAAQAGGSLTAQVESL
jgi:hypothetical protein